jgi:hypothetical protein
MHAIVLSNNSPYRKVEVGGEVGVKVMLFPMEKVKIWRIGVFLEG